MSQIIHRRDPSGITPPTVYDVPVGTNALDWLHATFNSQHELCGELACSFILNGKQIFTNDGDEPESNIDINLGEYDRLVIINRPAGIDPITAVIVAVVAISAVAAVLAYANMPTLPGGEEQPNSSPNNKLNAARNEFRPDQGIPECFGKGVSYPDFIQPSYFYYENNVKQQVGLFCISVGTVNVPVVRVGDTNILDIPDSSATVYPPGSTPSAEFLKIHQTSSNVDGQVLVAPDDASIVQVDQEFTATAGASTTTIVFATDGIVNDLRLAAGGYLYLRDKESLVIYPGPGETASTTPPNNIAPTGTQALRNGSVIHRISPTASGTITALDFSGLTATIGGVSVTLSAAEASPDLTDGVYEIASVNANTDTVVINTTALGTGDFIGTVGRGYGGGVIGPGLDGELDTWIGWFTLSGEEIEEVWLQWQGQRGIRTGNGKYLSIAFEFEIESVINGTPTGNRWKQTQRLEGNTLEAQFRTARFEPASYPGMPRSGYRARMRRISNVVGDNASEEIKMELLESVTPYINPNFGDTTELLVLRKATTFSADQSGQKINCDYERLLPVYNRITGVYDTSTLAVTDSFADAAAYTLIVAGNEDPAGIDLDELYGINDNLSDSRLGEFTFTFTDANLSKGERIDAICNVARVAGYHDGRTWRFSRDEAKPVRAALFNRRNVTGRNARQSWLPQREDDADSVRIFYVDPDTNTEATIDRKFNLSTGKIISGDIGINPKEIKLAGCRNEFQATNRAELEIRRIAYQRRSVQETTFREALELELLDRVGWVDINDVDTFDGEIIAVNGDVFDTTERFIPELGKSYVVFVTDDEGYSSNTVQCLPRNDTEFGFIASGISGAYVADGLQQFGSRYFIADADDLAASNFTIKTRTPTAGQQVEIELIEYRPEMYELDDALPPSAPPIIASGLIVSDITQSGTDATATLTVKDNGEMLVGGITVLWYSGGETPNIGDAFEARVTVISGTTPSGIVDSWVDIDGDPSWSIAQSLDGANTNEITLEIRQKDYTTNIAENNLVMQAVVAAPVALPASIDVTTVGGNPSQARIDFEPDGTWSTNDGDSGAYVTVAENIGVLYEVQATNLIGDAPAGPTFGAWHTLDGSGVEWILSTVTTATCTFDVEIREIADPLNTTTSAISMTTSV